MAHPEPWHKKLQRAIETRTITRFEDDYDVSFITVERLASVWRDHPKEFRQMQIAIQVEFDNDSRRFPDYAKVISILIMIGFEPWDMVSRLIERGFRDSKLPLRLKPLKDEWFTGVAVPALYAKRFYQEQFVFDPIYIRRDEDLVFMHRGMRLPIERESPLGKGSYGSVTKVDIAKGYISKVLVSDGNEVTQSNGIARKKFYSVEAGLKERELLQRLRNPDLPKANILSSFASVVIGPLADGRSEYHLFFDCAPADLNKFLRHDDGSHQQLFIRDDSTITPKALFKELCDLIGALQFLHRDDIRICHSDLKPDNILIFVANGHPIGKWMITDFGIASVEPAGRSRPQVMGDMLRIPVSSYHQSTRSVFRYDQRETGPFQPPEVLTLDLSEQEPGHRLKGDIWSLGCISVCVLVYAIGGKALFTHLQQILHTTSQYNGERYFYRNYGSSIVLHPEMVEFLDTKTHAWDTCGKDLSPPKVWAKQAWKIIEQNMLQIPINNRLGADKLTELLAPFVEQLVPDSNGWSDFHGAGVRDNTDPTAHPSSTLTPNPTPPRVKNIPSIHDNPPRQPISGSAPSHPTADVEDTQDSDHPRSNTPPISPVQSVRSSISTPSERDVLDIANDDCIAAQIFDGGMELLFLTPRIPKCVSRNDGSLSWRLKSFSEHFWGTNTCWAHVQLAGWFCLLRRSHILPFEMRLVNLNLNQPIANLKEEWSTNRDQQLSDVTKTELSSKGYIAVATDWDKVLKVFTHTGERIINQVLVTSSRSGRQHEGSRILAIGYDTTGQCLAVTTSEGWLVWDLDGTQLDQPSRTGSYSKMSYDFGNRNCLLRVFSGGRYLLLYSESRKDSCLLVETVGQKRCLPCRLNDVPKPGTITLSQGCDWLVYLSDTKIEPRRLLSRGSRKPKDSIHYCKILKDESDPGKMPFLGDWHQKQLSKIRTGTTEPNQSVKVALRVLTSENGPFVMIVTPQGSVDSVELSS